MKDSTETRVSASVDRYDTVVVGAGPYGLSTAAHLQGQGLRVRTFGRPLALWREHMPRGMCLRSHWWATNLSDPFQRYGLAHYFQQTGQQPVYPLPIATFLAYAQWFRRQAVPDVDETYVARIERSAGAFTVTLEDGRVVQSETVVMAPGLCYYTHYPAEFGGRPPELVSHTADHRAFDQFAGKTVLVVGGGQSAVETAALLHESGAQTHLASRRPLVWLAEPPAEPRPLRERLRRPQAGIGPGWLPWGLEHVPYVFPWLPRATKDSLMRLAGPAAAAWLRPQVEGRVVLHEGQIAQGITEGAGGLQVVLSRDGALHVDHLVLGTGYRVNVARLLMVSPLLRAQIRTYRGAPVLSDRFESSVPGLYFTGISAFSSCGPLFRFVVGTDAAARRVARSIVRQVAHTR